MPIETDLQVFYRLSSNVDDSWNSDNGTNSGISFGTHGGVISGDYTGPDHFSVANSIYNFSFGTGDFTFSMWVNPDVVSYGPTAAGTLLGTDYPNYELSIYQGDILFYLGGAGNSQKTNTGSAVSTGSWQHVLITRTGGAVTIYINNATPSQTSTGSPGTADITSSGTPQFQSGQRVSSANNHYDGKMCDLCMWKRALTGAEITAIYGAGAGNFSTLLPELRLKGLIGSLVHNAPPDVLALEGLWGSLVHSSPPAGAKLEGLWGSLVHSVPTPTAIVPDITGAPLVPATFDGSASIMPTYYHWSWVSVPGGSAIANAPIPFPDGGVSTPLDMTDNEGLWHFEGNANDSSGNARNGTVSGASLVAGKVGAQAYQFGVADNINFGAASAFVSANFSLSLWLKGDPAWTPAVWDSVAGASNAFTWSQGFGIFWQNATTLRCFVGAYNGTFADITVVAANWNHIVMVYDGVNITTYLNGSQASQVAYSAALTGLTNDFFVSYMGTHGGGEQTIDEVAIWSRAVSAAEVTSIYTAQNGTLAGLGTTHTFTPDLDGTYTINLAISPTVNTNADAVIAVPTGGGGTPIQGENVQGSTLQSQSMQGTSFQGN